MSQNKFNFKKLATFNLNQKGISLVEVLLGLVILSIIVLIYTALTNTSFASRLGRYQPIATKIASKKIEEVRNSNFGILPASGPITDSDLSKLPNSSATLAISDYPGTTNLKQVTVIVNWQEGQAPKNVQLDTLITAGGIGNL